MCHFGGILDLCNLWMCGVPGVQPADAVIGLHGVCESLHVLHLQGLHQALVRYQHFHHRDKRISSRRTIGFPSDRQLYFFLSYDWIFTRQTIGFLAKYRLPPTGPTMLSSLTEENKTFCSCITSLTVMSISLFRPLRKEDIHELC